MSDRRIAIAALGGIFPDAPNASAFWDFVAAGRSAFREPPQDRWLLPVDAVHRRGGPAPDKVVSRRGCFIDRVPHVEARDPAFDVRRLDEMVQLGVAAATQTLAGVDTGGVDPRRIGVCIGNIALPTPGGSRWSRSVLLPRLAAHLGLPTPVSTAAQPLDRYVAALPAIVVAGRFGFRGGVRALDAACASSLYAIKLAIDDLLEGRCDAVLSGGMAKPDSLYTQMGFSQLHALSPTGECRPFDAAADGLVVGEGACFFVLERLADAVRRRRDILGVIHGVALSNDVGGNILAPDGEGQLRALREAYRRADWRPDEVDQIECHATGTPTGDRVELASLAELWRGADRKRRCVLGAVKSNVGHLLTGAGAAGLAKVVGGLRRKRLFPTAGFQCFADGDAMRGPFAVLSQSEDWPAPASGGPRRAAVSAFGFGGINAHLLVEEWTGRPLGVSASSLGVPVASSDASIVGVGVRVGEWIGKEAFARRVLFGEGPPLAECDRECVLFDLPSGRFPVPPKEFTELLPQQTLMLQAVDEAWREAGGDALSPEQRKRVGGFFGVSLDLNAANFDLRWAMLYETAAANRELDDSLPPLNADRTLGALASVVASRIARVYKLGGPNFALSCEEASGVAALDAAARALRRGEIDLAIVGAVDLPTDPRVQASERELHGASRLASDAGVALVLKRSTDAKRDGDFEYAVVRETAANGVVADAIFDPSPLVGNTGAASGLVGVAQAALALAARILPAAARSPASYWIRNRSEGPRRASISATSVLGESWSTVLEQSDAPYRRHSWIAPSKVGSQEKPRSNPTGLPFGELAFVYPGSGVQFAGMGRGWALAFPEAMDELESECVSLRDHFVPEVFWNHSSDRLSEPLAVIQGQASLGILLTRILKRCGVRPNATIGYSLGESTALFAMGAWNERDEMFRRLRESPLFQSELAGECRAAHRRWRLPANERVDWAAVVVNRSANVLRDAVADSERIHLLALNGPRQCVLGGERRNVLALLESLNAPFLEVHGASTVHCSVAREVESDYLRLHELPTSAPAGVRFYSGAWGRSYTPTMETAARAIADLSLDTIDFPRVVEQAYQDGVRVFLEIGPGASCSKLIGAILGDRPHRCIALCTEGAEPRSTLRRALRELNEAGFDVDSDLLDPSVPSEKAAGEKRMHVDYPRPRWFSTPTPTVAVIQAATPLDASATRTHSAAPVNLASAPAEPLIAQWSETQEATAKAHAAYLSLQRSTTQQWLHMLERVPAGLSSSGPAHLFDTPAPPRSLNREQCLAFAVGRIGDVLGRRYAEIDSFPTRVRLPDEPLMLVDRIVAVEGEPLSMRPGRVVTEHDVLPNAWYLDAGRIATCIAVESGQADLFLSGFLGVDLETRGLAMYRLLDAAVTFHAALPPPGATIRYDIRIERFFEHAGSHFFRFQFDATVNGKPLLTMRDGCAGFFTRLALDAGRGVVRTAIDDQPRPGKKPEGWTPPVSFAAGSLTESEVDALRRGDLPAAFGDDFRRPPIRKPAALPTGKMRLVHRVPHFDPHGGRYGLGVIRGEADVHADDWFLTCHFIDDRVMPGTLMYECCLHALRILLMRMGWIGEAGAAAYEPVPGVASRLKCRGQVIESTKTASYEVEIKEVGFNPAPFVLADALMYADGKPIVEMTDMSLQLSGATRTSIDSLWLAQSAPTIPPYDKQSILEFAVGRPSAAFGERYRVFDSERFIARLPAPPYQFLDRIVRARGAPFAMKPGASCVAEYDAPPEEWYFADNGGGPMPYAVLLEVALQPCGWLAAYVGSALTSDEDLHFRNLGGRGVQRRVVDPAIGTLQTRVELTGVSSSGGMIIQHYTFDVRAGSTPIYSGDTYFGFFTKSALENQVGVREADLHKPKDAERGQGKSFAFPNKAPHAGGRLRMMDDVAFCLADDGPNGLGLIEGRKIVRSEDWFFKAHFHQDPVWPGSLGLEAMLQLMGVWAAERWGAPRAFQATALGAEHRWTYRGQVLPTAGEVVVQAAPTRIDDENKIVAADGLLAVDGRVIYTMSDFTIGWVQG